MHGAKRVQYSRNWLQRQFDQRMAFLYIGRQADSESHGFRSLGIPQPAQS
jgi:hypothetical protein